MRKQIVFLVQSQGELPQEHKLRVARNSVEISQSLGLAGRVFVSGDECLVITEGPEALVDQYFEAILSDDSVKSCVLQDERIISEAEFLDYSVWLDFGALEGLPDGVHRLTTRKMAVALPPEASGATRILFSALVTPTVIAA